MIKNRFKSSICRNGELKKSLKVRSVIYTIGGEEFKVRNFTV
jgi:hypothetical protein